MCTKYGLNSRISLEEYQRQSREHPQANKAFFEVNSQEAKQVIKKANKVFARIWPENEPSDCTKMSQSLLKERKQRLAPLFIFIKSKRSQEVNND